MSAPDIARANPPDPSRRYLVLDGLRGLAAIAVMLDHIPSGPIGPLVPGRYLAVEFFFVLSGFVMAHAYQRRLDAGMGALELLKVRFIRLYPLYLIGFVLGGLMWIYPALKGWDPPPTAYFYTAIACGLFMLPTPPGQFGELYPFNGPSWTLFFELAANVIYALVSKLLTWRVFAVLLVLSGAASIATTFEHSPLAGPWRWDYFDRGAAHVIYGFFMGVFLYRLNAVKRLPKLPAWLSPILLVLVFAMPGHDGWLRQAEDALATVVLMPLIVAGFANSEVKGRTAKLAAWLGLISYGVYVTHVPISRVVEMFFLKALGHDAPGLLIFPVMVVLVLLVVTALDMVYDQPMRRWLTSRLSARRAPLAPAK